MIYEIPVHTGILTRSNRNVENIFQNLTFMFKMYSDQNPVKSNVRLSWNCNRDLKFWFRIDLNRNVKKYILVPVIRTGIVFGQIRFPVLKTPFRSYPRQSAGGHLVGPPVLLRDIF